MSVSRLARLAGLATAVTLVATLVGGCGAARPGVAAEVGDDTITVDQVDELAADLCSLQEAVPEDAANRAPATSGVAARDGAMQALLLRSIADQMAAEHGVTADEDFQAQVDQTRLQYGGIDEELIEAGLPAYTAIAYFINIMRQVGEKTGDASGDQALVAGIQEAQKWQKDHPIETNPMFGSFKIGNQEIESERDDVAFPVSKIAKDAESGSEDYVASLPESQRCG